MVEMSVYKKDFPSGLINLLVDCGHVVKVQYCRRDMADPYCVTVRGRNKIGLRLIIDEFKEVR
jgi:hypothetical protein